MFSAVLYSLTEIETETEMFCKMETKYKRESEHMKRNSNETKLISQRKWLHKMFQKSCHLCAFICSRGDNGQQPITTLVTHVYCHTGVRETAAVWVCRQPESEQQFQHLCHDACPNRAIPSWTSGITAWGRCHHLLEETAGSLFTPCLTCTRPCGSTCITGLRRTGLLCADGWQLATETDHLKISRFACSWKWTDLVWM